MSKFPKLLKTGYKLLLYQRGEDAGFYNIPSPHTPQRIRDAAGNAKIYIRPLQKDLDESVVGEAAVLSGVVPHDVTKNWNVKLQSFFLFSHIILLMKYSV